MKQFYKLIQITLKKTFFVQSFLGMDGNDMDNLNGSGDPLNGGRSGAGSRSRLGQGGEDGGISRAGGNGFRFRLFRVYYWICKERNTSKFMAFVLLCILFAQVFDMIISPIMKLPFKGSLYEAVSDIFDIVRIYPAVIRYGKTNTYYFFMFAPLVISVIYVVLLLLIDASLRMNKGRGVDLLISLRLLQVLSTLFFWVFLVPTIDFFISIYECDNETGFHKVDTSMLCWTGKHAFFCALFAFGLFLFITLAVTVSLLYNESRPTHTDALTRQDINQEFYLTIYRIALVAVSHYTADYGTFQWLVLALHGIICIHLVKNYQHYLPYYQNEVSVTYGALCLAYAWLVLNAIIVKAFDSEAIHYEGQIIVICLGFILMWPTAKYMRGRRVKEIMILKQQEKLRDDLELDQFVINFQHFMSEQESSEESSMMFLGFLYMHREECQQQTCPLRINTWLYQPLNDATSKRDQFPSKDKILHHHFVNSVFLDYQRSHPNTLSAFHHTSFAQFLFYQMGNVHMALIELNLASKASASSSSSFQQAFTIFKYKQLIEEHLYKKFKQSKANNNGLINMKQSISAGVGVDQQQQQQQPAPQPEGPPGINGGMDAAQIQAYATLDVSIVITFENLFNRFEKVIEQSATDHIEFWSHLDSNMIDLNVINKLGLNIINRTKRVNDLWTQLIKINPTYPNALYLYGNYLSQIKNDIDQGEEYKQQYQNVKRMKQLEDYENQFDIMFAEDTAVIIMNGSREQQGKIMKTNQGIFKLFGYSMFEVQGHDVNILMPPVIAQKHQFFLDNYFKTGKERILNSCLESFAMYRTGVIFPVHIVVKPVPSLRNDIQYIGMIKSACRDYEYIITDENGKIDSISEGVISLLKLPISFFKEHEIPIQVVVPELCEVQRFKNPATGQHEICTHFDAWTGQKDLKFIIPKNFSNAGGRGHFAATSTPPPGVPAGGDITADRFDQSTPYGDSRFKNMDDITKKMTPQQPTFIGMRSPESLKSVCSMFKNAEHKAQPEKYKNNLWNHVNYAQPDFEKVLKTDIQQRIYAGGEVRIKVFKIFFNRKNKKGGDGKRGGVNVKDTSVNGSENSFVEGGGNGSAQKGVEDDTLLHAHGMSAMQTLNDNQMFQKYMELIAQISLNRESGTPPPDLSTDIKQLQTGLERLKRARYNGRIQTADEYEKLEVDRMITNLKEIERFITHKNHRQDSIPGRVNNPIAAAFAHRLSIFVKTQAPSPVNSGRKASANLIIAGEDKEEEFKSKMSIQVRNDLCDVKRSVNGSKANSQAKEPSRAADESPSRQKPVMQTADPIGGRTPGAPKLQRDFMIDYFQRNNNFSNTAFVPAAHNDLIRNLQSKFKVSGGLNDSTPKRAETLNNLAEVGDATGKHAEELEAEQKSVKLSMEDGQSIGADSKTLISQLRVLRNALYENYSPQSIDNLRYSARFVMVVLIAMTIASFLFSQQKYDQLKENFKSVQHSQERMQSVTSINTAARFCHLMNEGKVDRYRYGPTEDFLLKMRTDLNTKAMNLQRAQTNLSTTVYDFTEENKYKINSNNITLYHNVLEEVGRSQTVNVRTATIQLAINAYKVKDLKQFVPEQSMSLWFILSNSMNNILVAISDSTQAILADTRILSDDNKRILMILLLVASGCLLLSMFIIMPVVTKVHKDKDKLLSLFLQIDSEDVKEQLKRCREFFQTFHSDDKGPGAGQGGDHFSIDDGDIGGKGEEDDENDRKSKRSGTGGVGKDGQTPRGDKANEGGEQQQQAKSKFTRKNKKLKKYSTNYMMLLMKFFFVITFLESYFLYQYFQSDNFLIRSLSMIKEAASITNLSFANFLLYQVLVEMVATNGTAMVFNTRSSDFITGYLDNFAQEIQSFLKVHSDNIEKHDSQFNDFFTNLVLTSVCSTIGDYFATNKDRQECSSYLGGVLDQGLRTANIAYWDDMREIRDAFFKSDRSPEYLKSLLNSPRMIAVERLNEIYFAKAFQVLLDKQNESIAVQFNNRNKEIVALFSVYLALLVLAYFIVWGRFVESMRHSLWVTKSMLAIIPIDVIEKVKVIKDFLLATSQAAVRSMKE